MKIGVPKEIHQGERSVAMTPEVALQLSTLGFSVAVEAGAGITANFTDEAFSAAGCEIVSSVKQLWVQSDIVCKVRAPEDDETLLLEFGQTLISFIWPVQNPEILKDLNDRGVNVIAMDSIFRISHAQKMVARSSMANISGYGAIIEAAEIFGRPFTGQLSSARKVSPVKVLVIGAGLAGLSAIATAKSMGAIVRGFDTGPEVQEQVERLDAEFLMLNFEDEDCSGLDAYGKVINDEFVSAEMTLFAAQAKEVDIIITIAMIPGKPAPLLITADMIKSMKEGSVVVDIAAEQGGNCELTVLGDVTVKHGVSIVGYTELPRRLAAHSSQLYGTNLFNLLADMTPKKDGKIVVDIDDEFINAATICTGG
jgi:NAD(P) transhydrogenase subunit alpha